MVDKEIALKYGFPIDVITIQDVINNLSSIKLPKGRKLNTIPFGIINKVGKTFILREGLDKHDNHLRYALTLGGLEITPLLDFRKDVGIVISDKDDLYKELEYLRKENTKLKNKLERIKKECSSITIQ